MPTELALLGNVVIAVAYAAITVAIAGPVMRARQFFVNRLATATAFIFLSCSVGHGFHAAAYARELASGMAHMAPMWPSAVWDLCTGGVAVYYWTLRRRYGALLGGGGLYESPGHRRHLDEANAREERARTMLSAVVEQSDDAIIGTDLTGAVTAWNAGAERMLGYTAAEAAAAPAGTFLLGLTDEERRDRLARVAAGERDLRYDARAATRDGGVVEVAVALSPMFDAAGRVAGTAQIARDVGAARRAEAMQRMASLGQLAGGVAHDFNNLLGIIVNCTDFAAEQVAADSPARADLAQVRTAAERAAALTRQLLTFTRQDRVRPQVIDVNAAIAEAYAMLTRTIGEHIHLVTRPAPAPLPVLADAGHLQQVLINLAVNARDAMPDGGTLCIEARRDPEASAAVLTVSDTGTGMPPDVAARVFEPFYTTKAKGQGTGLGLATVYGIVTAAGGTISVYSEPGVGTTFRVALPLATDPAQPAPAEPPASVPPGAGQTILVVEDEPALGRGIARILDGHGYRAHYARTAAEATALAEAHGCDLLLTDVIMPEVSGPQVAERLRRDHPDLPVVYMSGYTDGLLDATGLLTPGTAVIEKPFTAATLLTRIHEHLNPRVTRR